jgi:hypothetical protein
MASGKRDLALDAFYDDEWPLLPVLIPNPRGVQFNRFTTVIPGFPIEPMTKFVSMPNPLNPAVIPNLSRPEIIPAQFQSQPEGYCIFIPPALIANLALNPQAIANVTLLFCVGTEFNRHGLRTFFASKADRVLITISGREADNNVVPPTKAWGVGITDQQIRQLFTLAGFPSANFMVDTLAGYSTGHRGVNGTVNNGLISLANMRRLVFLDALYRGDDPAPGGNTSLMLQKVSVANPNVDLIVYEVTDGGTPRSPTGQTAITLPSTAKFINLKPQFGPLVAFLLARISDNGVKDGYFGPSSVPQPIRQLSADLPPRGTLASSPLTQASATNGTLASWAATRLPTIAAAVALSPPLVTLIQTNVLTGWAFPDTGSMCHDGFMPEFGWEFLT